MRNLFPLTGLLLALWLLVLGAQAAEPIGGTAARIDKTGRGAIAETARFRAEIRDGVLVSFFNKLTGEEYLAKAARPDGLLPHLPSGLGTQHTDSERESAQAFRVAVVGAPGHGQMAQPALSDHGERLHFQSQGQT